jgi:hypothetical protein
MVSFEKKERTVMRTIRIFTMLLFVISTAVCFAQQDTTDKEEVAKPLPPDPSTPAGSQVQIPPAADNYKNTNPLVRIRLDAIPSGLKKSLEGDRYRGWEKDGVFQNPKTLEYSIDIRSGDSLKTFRFDKFGNPLNPNTPTKDND